MKKILKILLLTLLGVVVIGTFVMLWKKSRPKITDYELFAVRTGSVENTTIATGKILPRDEVMIKPQIPGIISEIHKEAGEYVRRGEIIALVKVIPEMSSLNAAESRVRIAEIAMKSAESEYDRQKMLFGNGVISSQEMEQSDSDFKRASEELENARNNLNIIRDGITSDISQSSNTQVRSTIDGMILDIPVKVGNSVIQSNTFNDGTTIATVANINDLLFVGRVDETEVGRIHAGMPVKLTIGALPGQKFDALLEYVAPKGTEENGAILFDIKAAVSVPDSVVIRAGYSANAEIVLERAEDVLLVSEGALAFEQDSTFVHVLTDSLSSPKKFEKRAVIIGLSDGIDVEIREGVDEHEKLRGHEIQR